MQLTSKGQVGGLWGERPPWQGPQLCRCHVGLSMGGAETTVSFGEEVGNSGVLPGRGRWLFPSAGLGRLRLTVLSSGTHFIPMNSEGMLDLPELRAAPKAALWGPEPGGTWFYCSRAQSSLPIAHQLILAWQNLSGETVILSVEADGGGMAAGRG